MVATIKVLSSYTFNSVTSVSVGGKTLSTSDYTVSGQIVTVPANKINGNVVIVVATEKVNTEPEVPGTGGGNTGGDTGGDVEISEVQIEVTLLANSYISKDSGELVTNETYKNWTATEYISVNANEKYRVVASTFTGGSSGVGALVYGYDSNKTPLVCILGETDTSSGAMFSIPENVKYIRVGTI